MQNANLKMQNLDVALQLILLFNFKF